MPSLRAFVGLLAAVLFFAVPVPATWSILIVDLATGEVAVGIATCLTGFDLRPNTVVVVPGRGVAAAQSFVGPLTLRQLIREQLLLGTPPSQILTLLQAADPGHQSRQYGIVDTLGGAATFTGTGAGAWAGGLTGQVGTLVYSVQGNVLTGQPVITAAEQAIQTTPGTVADKLMAAMQAARQQGGDGRCSCTTGGPTACGSPPPSFTKSSHIGLMIVSRPGDLDAPCNGLLGCGAGTYYLDLNVANQPASAPDPVIQLQQLYNTWRAQQAGRPDHFTSTVTTSATRIRSNGLDTVTGTVVLRDAQGNPLGNGIPVTVGLSPESTVGSVAFGPVTPEPNGSYSFTMTGDLESGTAVLDVVADDGLGRVRISPAPVVIVDDPFGACGQGAIGDGMGGVIDALRIGGSGGGAGRVVKIGYDQPFVLTVDPPVGTAPVPPVGLFALWAHLGVPPLGVELPVSAGTMCFQPAPFNPIAPTVLVADAFGAGGALAATPAPWTVGFPGLPALLDVTLQGAMLVDTQGTVAATNALMLRVQALPEPAITNVMPRSAPAGATVTVQGRDFFIDMRLDVAGQPVPITALTPTSATFTMPAGVPCDSQLALTNPGTATVTTTINPTPVIQSTPFSAGPAAGGNLYVIGGANLGGCTVTIGGNPLNITAQGTNAITGTVPPGAPGVVPVVVTSPVGCQAMTTYTYQ